MKKKLIFILILAIITVYLTGCSNSNNISETKPTTSTASTENKGKNVYESLLKDGKSYENFNNKEKKLFLYLTKNWDSQEESFKNKYKSKKESLENQKEKLLKKEHEKSKEKYKNLITDIENDFPNMKVDYVSENDDGNTICINMNLLKSIDATTYKCSELLVKKETKMKNNNISKIQFFVENNGENAGLLFCELQGGEYHPTLNTIK